MRQFAAALSIFLLAPVIGCAQTPTEYEKAKKLIWEKELAINAARPVTGPADYLESSSDRYVAWPLTTPPVSIEQLRERSVNAKFPNKERLELFFEDFALEGDTAIIYYSTHRTRLGDGTAVDQRYQVGHVWVRDEEGMWKMLGSMVRESAQPKEE